MLSSHFPHTSCHPCLPPPHLFFSTDNRQSSHAVHLLCLWRRPSESPNPLTLLPQNSLWTFFHLSSVCPLSLSIPMNTTHSIAALMVCRPSLPSQISLFSVISLSAQYMLLTTVMTCSFSFFPLLFSNFCTLNLPFMFSLYRFSYSPPPLTVFPCLCQDTAEYVAYVAKDPVNQRGEK